MAAINHPVTHGSLLDEEIVNTFSAERRSVDVLSSDLDSSTEGSVGGDSSFWESSDRDNITVDESEDNSTEFSGSSETNDIISLRSSDSPDGEKQQPVHRYQLRSRKKCKPPAKRTRYASSSDEDETDGSTGQVHSRRQGVARGRGKGRGRKCGQSGARGQGQSSGKQAKVGKERAKKTSGTFLACAVPISTPDFRDSDSSFCPLREDGPHIPPDTEVSAIGLFELFFDISVMDRILRCTYAYTESKKEEKKGRYKLFMKKK